MIELKSFQDALRERGPLRFEPQQDITAYELARCWLLVELGKHFWGHGQTPLDRFDKEPIEVKRHFVERKPLTCV